MVKYAAAVILHCCANFFWNLIQVGKKIFQKPVKKIVDIFRVQYSNSSGRLHDVYRGESLTVRASMIGSSASNPYFIGGNSNGILNLLLL
jgi:hypothetical protein